MGKLLTARGTNSSGAPAPASFLHSPTVHPEALPRSFYALARNANATTAGELAVLVAASEGAEIDSAYFTAAVNWGLEAVGLPVKFRGYVDILIELSAEDTAARRINDWFAAADVKVGSRARLEPTPPVPPAKSTQESVARYKYALAVWKETHDPTCPETGAILPRSQNERTLRAWAARERKKLVAWQQLSNVTLVQVEEGNFDRQTRKNRPTRYRLLFLEQVAEVLRRAKASDLWRRTPLEAIKQEARAVFRVATDASSLKPRKYRGKSDTRKRLERRRKAIVTLLKGCREDLREIAPTVAEKEEWLEAFIDEARKVFTSDRFGLCGEPRDFSQGGTQKCGPPASDSSGGDGRITQSVILKASSDEVEVTGSASEVKCEGK